MGHTHEIFLSNHKHASTSNRRGAKALKNLLDLNHRRRQYRLGRSVRMRHCLQNFSQQFPGRSKHPKL